MEDFSNWLLYIVLGLVIIFIYQSRYLLYWKNQGIPYLTPIPIVGSWKTLEFAYRAIHDIDKDYYNKYGQLFGHFQGPIPVLNVGDPELIKLVMVKDFHLFTNRGTFPGNDEFNKKMLFSSRDENWKRIRSAMTPAFTSGKMRKMAYLINECAQSLKHNLNNLATTKTPTDIKRLVGAFTMDVISSTAFATRIDSHKDPDNPIVENARKLFTLDLRYLLPILQSFPKVVDFLMRFANDPLFFNTRFFKEMTNKVLKDRRQSKDTERSDFLQLMVDAQKNSEVNTKGENDKDFQITHKMTEDEIFAQCVAFFIVGYDTTATTITMALFLLAWNPGVQIKAQEQIDIALGQSKGEINYDVLKTIPLAEGIISETLRIYPTISRTERQATEDYVLGDTGVTIPKGGHVHIPVCALHMDPKYFPEPEKFKPERHLPENRESFSHDAYMPFGVGPRNCIATRFAQMEAGLAIVHILKDFTFKPSALTKKVPEFKLGQFLLQPAEVHLNVERRKVFERRFSGHDL